jgi:RecJ-like exonuclease
MIGQQFEACGDCDGEGRVDDWRIVQGVDRYGTFAEYREVEIECTACDGRGKFYLKEIEGG